MKSYILFTFATIVTFVYALHFEALNKNSAWPHRNYPEVHAIRNPLKYTINNESHTAKSGSFIMYGGAGDSGNAYGCWLSIDHSVTWIQLSCNNVFSQAPLCTFCSDSRTDVSYAISYNVPAGSYIWLTDNFNSWNRTSTAAYDFFWNRYKPSCLVNSYSEIMYFFGSSIDKKQFYTDVWVSLDNTQSWKIITNTTNIPPRINQLVSIHLNNTHLHKDISYVLGGTTETSVALYDLWASSDSGNTWIQVLTSYPWVTVYSGLSGFKITPDGILLYMNINIIESKHAYGEIWASLNGGYTWGRCSNNTEYGPRFGSGIIWGQDGYLRILGGTVLGSPNQYTDSWISDISFNDWSSIAATCDLQVPKGGIGIITWPI